MKRILFVGMLSILTLALVACGSGDNDGGSDEVSNSNVEDSSWAEENGMYETESVEELYEKAKEEGNVVIYAKSSRFKTLKDSFEKEYPGITVEPYKISRVELKEKLVREHEAGVYNADLAFTTVEPELIEQGIFNEYKPEDIMNQYLETYRDMEPLINIVDLKPFFYNTNTYDSPPISNWWDLTEPEWEGKVFFNDPITDVSLSETFIAMIEHSDDMAQAYKDKYEKDIELTEENAGYEFILRLLQNDPVLISSGEDIIESIGQSGKDIPHIGIAPSSKLRHIEQSEMPLAAVLDINPKISAVGSSTLYVVDQAPHPNAAKLAARWFLGEADGKSEGLDPFNELGTWIPRTDIEDPNPVSIDEIEVWSIDAENYAKTFPVFRSFWLANLK